MGHKFKNKDNESGNTSETEINIQMGVALRAIKKDWEVDTEPNKIAGGKKPDIVVRSGFLTPVVIETEIIPAVTVDKEAKNRIGLKIGKETVNAVISVRDPKRLTHFKGDELANEILKTTDFEYAVYFEGRYPKHGYIRGDIRDIARAALATSVGGDVVKTYVGILEDAMTFIEQIIDRLGDSKKQQIAKLLNQPISPETWKMAGLIMSNAMVFYDLIADKIDLGDGKSCKTLAELRSFGGSISQNELSKAWQIILSYNYNPIFDVAVNIINSMAGDAAGEIISELDKVTSQIHSRKMAGSADMYGTLFQKVIGDSREKLASYYTRPAAAMLLSVLSVPQPNHPVYSNDKLRDFKIADFACGTGLLLSSVYRQIIFNYESSVESRSIEKNAEMLHKSIMENSFIGLDVMPIATHLTVSALAMMYPQMIFEKTNIKTMPIGLEQNPYGKDKKPHYRLGSLDLIQTENDIKLIQPIKPASGKSKNDEFGNPWSIDEAHHRVKDNSCDLIVMNPPFVRATNNAKKFGKNKIPAWAAFQTTAKDQSAMGKLASKKFKDTCYHGHAGLASAFIAVCNKKIRDDGIMSLIIPATVANGKTWKGVRDVFRSDYDITVVSIAYPKIKAKERSFSTDTGMGEVILLAKKRQNQTKSDSARRGIFISIHHSPHTPLEALKIGKTINEVTSIHTLESGLGGTSLRVGDITFGTALDCPIDEDWKFVNVFDPVVEQMAHQMKQSMIFLNKVADISDNDRNIVGSAGQAFELLDAGIHPKYPSLWGNVKEDQTKFIVPPDSRLEPKPNAPKEKINRILNMASHLHINIGPDYTANSLIGSYTTKKTVGGTVWPNIILRKEYARYEKPLVVWLNSTMGILSFWSIAGKQQLGRGRTSRTNIKHLPIPDFDKIDKKNNQKLMKIFDKYSKKNFDRMKNLWKDNTRIELDLEIVKIMGYELDLDDIRRRLCIEPSICGGRPGDDLLEELGGLEHADATKPRNRRGRTGS